MSKKSRGLFDYEYQLKLINAHKPPLQKLNEVINWEMFRSPIELAFAIEPKAPGGRPPLFPFPGVRRWAVPGGLAAGQTQVRRAVGRSGRC